MNDIIPSRYVPDVPQETAGIQRGPDCDAAFWTMTLHLNDVIPTVLRRTTRYILVIVYSGMTATPATTFNSSTDPSVSRFPLQLVPSPAPGPRHADRPCSCHFALRRISYEDVTLHLDFRLTLEQPHCSSVLPSVPLHGRVLSCVYLFTSRWHSGRFESFTIQNKAALEFVCTALCRHVSVSFGETPMRSLGHR